MIGGRTRTRTLDPLIKSRMISVEDQRPFRQMFHPSCIGHTIDFSFVGKMGLGQRKHEGTFVFRLRYCHRDFEPVGSGFESEVGYIASPTIADALFATGGAPLDRSGDVPELTRVGKERCLPKGKGHGPHPRESRRACELSTAGARRNALPASDFADVSEVGCPTNVDCRTSCD
jgi:hypothetical protein